MKYLAALFVTFCALNLAHAEEPQMGEIKWVCVSKEKFQQMKQVVDGNEALVAASFDCGKDDCDCEESESPCR